MMSLILLHVIDKVSNGAEAVDCGEIDDRCNGGHDGSRRRSTGKEMISSNCHLQHAVLTQQ